MIPLLQTITVGMRCTCSSRNRISLFTRRYFGFYLKNIPTVPAERGQKLPMMDKWKTAFFFFLVQCCSFLRPRGVLGARWTQQGAHLFLKLAFLTECELTATPVHFYEQICPKRDSAGAWLRSSQRSIAPPRGHNNYETDVLSRAIWDELRRNLFPHCSFEHLDQQHVSKTSLLDKMCDAKAAEWISEDKNNILENSGSADWPATLADVTTSMFRYIWNAAAGATGFFFLLLLLSLIRIVRHTMTLINPESDIKK